MQRARCFRKRGKIGGFRHRQLVHRFVEIDQRRCGDAVGAEAEIDFIEIEFEDAVLGIGALDAHRQQRFLDLARERHFIGQKEVLGDLLGDRRGALRTLVRAEVLHIHHGRARHAREVDAAVLVEVLVLGREERVGDELWHRLDRQIEPPLLGILAEQRAVGRMDARHHRRLVILKLRIVRQVPGEMPDPARDSGDADQEHHRSSGKQETQKPDHKTHYRSSIPSLEHASTELKHADGSSFCLSMISAQTRSADVARENRYPLFRIMLWHRNSRRLSSCPSDISAPATRIAQIRRARTFFDNAMSEDAP